jgi:hypothetical protein
MNEQHKATPEQWAQQALWVETYEDSSCIMELLHRVEALEGLIHELQTIHNTAVDWRMEQDHRLNQLEAAMRPRTFTAEEVAPIVVPTVKDSLTVPAGSLVERVAQAMHPDSFSPAESWGTEARAAIREVAAAALQMHPDPNLTWERVALWLDQEATR